MATSGHTHTLKLGGSNITVTTPSAVTSIIGPFAINTEANSSKAFSIQRDSSSEGVQHWVDDSEYHIDYTNNEKSSSIHWRIINTDTESPSNPKQTTDFHVYLDSSGNFRPGTNETGSIGTSSYKWKYIYGKTIYGDLIGNVTGNASTATNADKLDGYHATDLYIRNTHMYGLENLCIDVSKGGQTTKVDYKTITTSGTKSDTYFYVKTSENLVDGQIYSFGWYVTGYTGSATWTFYASNNSTCIPIHINKNGWVFGTGKMIVSGSAASNNILIDDAGSSNALALTFTNFVIVKGDIFPYYTVPISKMSVAYATNAGSASTTTNLATARNIWGQSFDGSADVNGNIYIDTGDTDKFIQFRYTANNYAGASWRLMSRGSGSGDTNYFDIETGGSNSGANTWNRVIRLTMDNRRVGINTDTVEQSLDVNGITQIYQRGKDNTAFKNLLLIKQQHDTEPSGDNWAATNASFGIGFNRYWTNNSNPYGETNCAGIYATVSSSWRGGLVFRTKNNQTEGGNHDITALRLAPSGKAYFVNQIISSLATGTAPLAVTSTTLNTNLNADLLDGYHANKKGTTDISARHIYSATANNLIYYKIGTLPTIANTGTGHSSVVFSLYNANDYGNNKPSKWTVTASSRENYDITAVKHVGVTQINVGYVIANDKMEIWVEATHTYLEGMVVEIHTSQNFTEIFTSTTTKPSNWVNGTIQEVSYTGHTHNNLYVTAVGNGTGSYINQLYYTKNGSNNYFTVNYATNAGNATNADNAKTLNALISIDTSSSYNNKYKKIGSYTISSRYGSTNGVIFYKSTIATSNNVGRSGYVYLYAYQQNALGSSAAITFTQTGDSGRPTFHVVETVTSTGTTIDLYAKIDIQWHGISFTLVSGDFPLSVGDWYDALPTGTRTITPSFTARVGYADGLTTARTIWGQSFNGTANVSGNMSSVGNISFSASGKNIGSILYFDTTNSRLGVGNSSPSYKLHVAGDIAVSTESCFIGYIPRKKSDGGGWAYNTFQVKDYAGTDFAHFGVYGGDNSLTYIYIGSNNYDSTANLKIDTSGYTTAKGYKKVDSSDSYVLLGGGGHIEISTLTTSLTQRTLTIGGNNYNVNSPYTSNINLDSVYVKKTGDTMVGTISASNDAYGGGGFNNGYANIILRGNTTTGTSGIVFSSSKGDTSINRPSDCAFIQYHPYGVSAATAVGTNPTIGTSGETGRFVIGIHNDSGDQLWLQTSAANDLKHVVGANVYTIYDSGNLPAYPTVNNAALTLQTNGTTQTTFYANDNTARTFNVTCANIGAATSGHNHDGRYVRSYGTTNDNIDSDWGQSIKTFDPIPSGTPPEQNPNITLLSLGDNWKRRKMLAFTWNNDNIYYRRHTDQGFSSWVQLIHSDNIGSQSVNYATSAGNADTVDGYHNTSFEGYYKTTIDASTLDANTWYPVVMNIGACMQTRIRIEGRTNAPGVWNTRSDKLMALMLDYTVQGSDWGWISPFRTIYLSQHGAGATGNPNIGNIGQLTNSATEYVYVRGGAIYNFYLSRPITPVIKTATYTISSQSVAPTTSAPTAPSRNNALISDITWANLSGKPSSFTPSSHDHDDRYLKLSGGTMSGLITTTSGSSHNGIKVGDTYINAIGGELIFQNNTAIRFGGDSWDWNVWAELGYAHSSKIVYLGLSGSPYSTNSTQTGGKIYTPGISNIYIGNGTYKVWHEGNDGSGSGLDADMTDGLHVHTGRNNEANKIVRTNANGYILAGYINSSNGDENNNSNPNRVWGTNGSDSYLRTYRTSALSVGSATKVYVANNSTNTNFPVVFTEANSTNGYSFLYKRYSSILYNPSLDSFMLGEDSVASGAYSFAHGYKAKATNQYAHAEGNETTASGDSSHAEGQSSTASGDDSHAEGYLCVASGKFAHAEGSATVASGYASHTSGEHTETTNSFEAAFGSWNASTSGSTVFSVGGGTENNRSNLFEIRKNGTILSGNATILDTNNTSINISGTTVNLKIGGSTTSFSTSGGSGSITHTQTTNTNNHYVLGVGNGSQPSNGSLSQVYSDNNFYFTHNGAYHASDARKKYDIRDVLNEDVNKLFETENGFIRHFKWINSNNDAYGFIAQELKEYCPEAVDFNNDTGYYSVNYNVAFSKIIGAMFKKIKELERKLQEKENH